MSTATKATHTPGPWHITEPPQVYRHDLSGEPYCNFNLYTRSGIISSLTRELDGDQTDEFNVQEHAANARLIAAAPEMLEALVRLEQAAQSARQALFTPNDEECRRLARASLQDALGVSGAAIRKARGEQ